MDIADVFNSGMSQIPTGLPFQAYLAAVISRKGKVEEGGEWRQLRGNKENQCMVSYEYLSPSGTTYVQFTTDIRNLAEWDRSVARLWEQTTALSDLDADVYQAMLIQMLNGPKDKDGNTIITATQILKYRGIQPRHNKNESGQIYNAGYKSEEIEAINDCIRRMEHVQITINEMSIIDDTAKNKGRKSKRTITHTSRLFMFGDRMRHTIETLDGSGPIETVDIAWQYRQSSWMLPFLEGANRFTGVFLQKILNYDPYHQQWEKRLARYLMYWLRINASRNPKPTITIGDLMQKLNLSVEERNPQRTKEHFEKAMNTIAKDELLTWKYESEAELPPRKWLATWLQMKIRVDDPPQIKSQYAAIANHAKTLREQDKKLTRRVREKGKS